MPNEITFDGLRPTCPWMDESHTMWRDSVRAFVEREIVPHIDEWEEAGRIPRDLYPKAAEAGLLGMQVIRAVSNYPIRQSVINHLAIVMTISLQITLFFVGAELFTEFFNETEHAASARYLFFGLNGHDALVPWIWTSLTLLGIATLIGMVHPLRRNILFMNIACILTVVGVWIEKGMGLVIPGFVPSPIGEIFEYTPSHPEIAISLGIWGLGLLIFTLLAKAAIPIECGQLRHPGLEIADAGCPVDELPKESTI